MIELQFNIFFTFYAYSIFYAYYLDYKNTKIVNLTLKNKGRPTYHRVSGDAEISLSIRIKFSIVSVNPSKLFDLEIRKEKQYFLETAKRHR